jgi:hypothetical protein
MYEVSIILTLAHTRIALTHSDEIDRVRVGTFSQVPDKLVRVLGEQRWLLYERSVRECGREDSADACMFGVVWLCDKRVGSIRRTPLAVPILGRRGAWTFLGPIAVDVAPSFWVDEAEFIRREAHYLSILLVELGNVSR